MIYLTALQDLYSPKIFRYWLYSLAITLVILAVLWTVLFGTLFSQTDILSEFTISNLAFKLPSWLVSTVWGIMFGAMVMASWFASTYLLSVLLLLILGFYTAPMIRHIRHTHYPHLPLPKGTNLVDETLGMLGIILKYALAFLGLLLVALLLTILLLFPLVALLFFVWGLMLFRRLLIADLANNISSSLNNPTTRPGLWAPSLLVYLMTLIPIVNLVAPVYGVVLFSHLMLQKIDTDLGATNRIPVINTPPILQPELVTKSSKHDEIDEASGD